MAHSSIISETASSAVPPNRGQSEPVGFSTKILRDGLLRRLARFTEGHLTLVDRSGSWSYGRPEADLKAIITVDDHRFYRMLVSGSSLGAADAFIRGYWSADDLVTLIRILARNQHVFTRAERALARLLRPLRRLIHWARRNSIGGSQRNIAAHYDLGEDFYKLFLDPTMTYSCAIFPTSKTTLEQASVEKLDRICRKLNLTPDDRVIEIGCGWGSFAIHAASRYGCHVTATTISRRQYEFTVRRVQESGLVDRIDVRCEDYRHLKGTYDKLVSIEMIEAVGADNIGTFLECCANLIQRQGLVAIQAITITDQRFADYRKTVDFIQSRVFPGACLISLSHLLSNARRHSDLRLIDLDDITPHYARTLSRWRESFLREIDAVRQLGFDDQFIRLWEYYLSYCEAGFREAHIGDVQLLLARPDFRLSGSERGRVSCSMD